jgi:small-conductance mechanosensitive channel
MQIDPTATGASDPAAAEQTATPLVVDFRPEEYLPEFMQPAWEFFQNFPIMFGVVIVIIGYLVGKTLQVLSRRSLRRLAMRTRTDLDDQLIPILVSPILQSFVVLSLIIVVLIPTMPLAFNQVLIRILVSVLLFLWARASFRGAHVVLDFMSAHQERFKAIEPRTAPLIEMGVKLFMLGAFVYLFLGIWGINGTAWLASAGVIGIAVGFAAKDTLANLISGVSIVADAPYKIGDYIVLDTGERGVVTRLGIRSTRLMTRDDVEISIPNAVIGNAKITNESGGPWVLHRIRIPVGVAYGSDTEKVVDLMQAVAEGNSGVVPQPTPRVRMRGFGDSALNFELLCWIPHPEMRGKVKHELLLEIDRVFRENGVEIPFPQRDLHIRSRSAADRNPTHPLEAK